MRNIQLTEYLHIEIPTSEFSFKNESMNQSNNQAINQSINNKNKLKRSKIPLHYFCRSHPIGLEVGLGASSVIF